MMDRELKVVVLALVSGFVFSTVGLAKVAIKLGNQQAQIENAQVRLDFNLSNGRYSGTDKTTQMICFRDAWFLLDPGTKAWRSPKYTYKAEDLGAVQDECGSGRKLRVWYIPSESYLPTRFLDINLYDDQPFVVLGWGIQNKFSYPVRVQHVELISKALVFDGTPPENAQVLRSGAGAERNFVESTWKINVDNGAMLTYRTDGKRKTWVAGGLRYAEFARKVAWQPDSKKKKKGAKKNPVSKPKMTLTVWDPQGKRVPSGTTWVSKDTFYLDFVTTDPFASLEHYGKMLAAVNHAHPNAYNFPTLCGWAVSTKSLGEGKSLNNSPGLVGQAKLAREAGILNYTKPAFRLEPDTYCYSYQGNTQQGWWDDQHWAGKSLKPPFETFSKFCKAVGDQGGQVFTYFQGSLPSNDFAAAHPDWMLNNDISLLHLPHPHHQPIVRYDYSDPGFRTYVLSMWKRLRNDGVRGIKFDYPETAWARFGGFEDLTFTTVSAYRELFRLCREGLGKDAFIHERILGGGTHESVPRTDVCAGIVDMQRIWSDSSHFEPEMASRMGLRWFKQGKVFRYYPDCKSLYVPGDSKTPLDPVARRSMLTLIGLLSGRIELATSFGSMTPEMMHDLTRLFPVLPNGQAFRPVDMLVTSKNPSVYTFNVTPDWTQVIFINNDVKKEQTISAPISGNSADTGALGLDARAAYHIFDFWNQKFLGTQKGNEKLSALLQPGEARIFAVRKAKKHPQILGTNRHVMCGMFELHNATWNSAKKTLAFGADIVAGEPLVISLVAPKGWRIKKVKASGLKVKHQQQGNLVRLQLDGGEKAVQNASILVSF